MLEKIPDGEATQIKNIVDMTVKQLQMRYPEQVEVLRGVHAKDHGAVTARFEVLDNIAEMYRHGVFETPGKQFNCSIRFSNAAVRVDSDSRLENNLAVHGSRGMAIKLLGVEGPTLGFAHGAPTQDFLMVNHPVFVFANVEDYEVLSRALLVENKDSPVPFFAERLPPKDATDLTPSQSRAVTTAKLAGRIQASTLPAAFQTPPASPVDNQYFSAAPFLLGPDQVMRFRVSPVSRSSASPNVNDSNYLRTALVNRLRDKQQGEVVFKFEIQVRPAESIDPETDIENTSHSWSEDYEFVHVATLTIPLQEFDSPEAQLRSERLFFTPWHGLEAHRPLGGINRLRRAVYEASAQLRNLPKEPSAGRCPFGH